MGGLWWDTRKTSPKPAVSHPSRRGICRPSGKRPGPTCGRPATTMPPAPHCQARPWLGRRQLCHRSSGRSTAGTTHQRTQWSWHVRSTADVDRAKGVAGNGVACGAWLVSNRRTSWPPEARRSEVGRNDLTMFTPRHAGFTAGHAHFRMVRAGRGVAWRGGMAGLSI